MEKNPVPCVASTSTSIYLLLALVKSTTEYFYAGVTAGEWREESREAGTGMVLDGGLLAQGGGVERRGGGRRSRRAVGGRGGQAKKIRGQCRGCDGVRGRLRRGGGGVPIRFKTYNIKNRRKGGLESALRETGKDNMDVGIFQETKLMDGMYTLVLAV